MKYFSTRGNSEALNFIDVLTSGTAKDGGLYVPENFPQFSKEEIATKSLAFSWGKGECVNYTHFTHIDESNTSIRDYWIANK